MIFQPKSVNGVTDYHEKVEMATTLSFIVGILHIAFGLFNLGSMAILLAKPVVAGKIFRFLKKHYSISFNRFALTPYFQNDFIMHT